jgi:hypothetical protein
VLGILLVAVAVEEEDRVFYQEVGFVVTPETILTVRKTPPGEEPFSLDRVHGSPTFARMCSRSDAPSRRRETQFDGLSTAGSS